MLKSIHRLEMDITPPKTACLCVWIKKKKNVLKGCGDGGIIREEEEAHTQSSHPMEGIFSVQYAGIIRVTPTVGAQLVNATTTTTTTTTSTRSNGVKQRIGRYVL